MTDKQWNELRSAVDGEQLNPLPVGFIIDSPWLPNWFGISILDYFTSDELWLKANLKAVEEFPPVLFLPGFWSEYGMCGEPSAFGSRPAFSQAEFPHAFPGIPTSDQIDELSQPDPRKDGLGPLMLNRLRLNRSKIEAAREGRKVCVAGMYQNHDLTHEQHKATLDHPEIYDFIDISQNSRQLDDTHWERLQWVRTYINDHPRPVNHTKTYGSDDRNRTDGDVHGIKRFWRNIIGGAASVRFHRSIRGGQTGYEVQWLDIEHNRWLRTGAVYVENGRIGLRTPVRDRSWMTVLKRTVIEIVESENSMTIQRPGGPLPRYVHGETFPPREWIPYTGALPASIPCDRPEERSLPASSHPTSTRGKPTSSLNSAPSGTRSGNWNRTWITS